MEARCVGTRCGREFREIEFGEGGREGRVQQVDSRNSASNRQANVKRCQREKVGYMWKLAAS